MDKRPASKPSILHLYGLLIGAILLCVIIFSVTYTGGGVGILVDEQAALEEAALAAQPTPTPTPKPPAISTAGRLTPFLSGSLWGYKNTAGEIAIPAQFSTAEAFRADADVAFAAQNGAYGLIDRNGLWVVEPMWSAFLPFSEGRAAVESGDKWGFVDETGALVIDYQFREVGSFSCGRAMARTGSSYGYIDPLGNMAVSEKFRFAGAFDGDVAFASAGDSTYIINKAGTPQYTLDAGVSGDHFSEDFALVQKNGVFYYISQYARQVFKGEFSDARSFSGGMAAVQVEGLWGYINSEGETAIRPQFYGAQDFSEGMAAVQNLEGLWGYINRSGSLRIDYAYSVAEPFLDGYARVKRGSDWLLLNAAGEEIFLYSEDGNTLDGLASPAVSPTPDPGASPSPSLSPSPEDTPSPAASPQVSPSPAA